MTSIGYGCLEQGSTGLVKPGERRVWLCRIEKSSEQSTRDIDIWNQVNIFLPFVYIFQRR